MLNRLKNSIIMAGRNVGHQNLDIECLVLSEPHAFQIYLGQFSHFHILISISNELTLRWLSTSLFRHFEQILVNYRELTGFGGHNMLYMGNRFFIEILAVR